jgi:hypothetical protein
MEWFIPLTIIPGVGLIIVSTSNILLTLNDEITKLVNKNDNCLDIIKSKLQQLNTISVSAVFQYINIFFILTYSPILKLNR